MKNLFVIMLILSGAIYHASSQDADNKISSGRDQALKIYLDCAYCDLEYFKSNFLSVNYITERKDADVYILVTAISTGGGGLEYSMQLKGLGRFKSCSDTVVFNLPPDATEELTRSTILENAQLGLVPFLMKTPAKQRLSLFIDEEDIAFDGTDINDPWRNWVFEVSGLGMIANQKTSKFYGLTGGLFIKKVTPEIKLESDNELIYNENRMSLYEGDSVIYSTVTSHKMFLSRNLFVKSLGEHCGLGGLASFVRDDNLNLDMKFVVGPAVEFNLYRYADASQKEFRFLYGVTYEHINYMDSTIFNKMIDNLFTHELHIKFMQIMDWGEIIINAWGTGYINDWTQYALGARASANIYIVKGFSFHIHGDFSYIQNQAGLRKGAVSPEEFLLGQREMETDYTYGMSIGFSYRFGSIFNNAVNPRFGP